MKILAPFAPHVTEELWQILNNKKPAPYRAKSSGSGSIHLSSWPASDESLIKDEEIKIVVQINGKVRTEIMIDVNQNEEEIKKQAIANEIISKHLVDQEIKKIIYVKNRLINIVL